MNRRALLSRAVLVAGGVAGAWWLRDNVLWRDPSVSFVGPDSGWLPYAEPRAAVPTVDVTLAGQTIRALVDSGAQYSVIDRGLYERLGLTRTFDLPLVAYGVGGTPQMGKGVTLEVSVGGMQVDGLRAAILALGPLAEGEGMATPLILGQDVLGQTVLELDTRRHRLRFVPKAGYAPPADVATIPVSRSRGALTTEVTVEGATIQAVVDTGASALLALSRDAATGAGLLDGREQRRGSSIVLGGSIDSIIVRSRTITIGNRMHREVDIPIFADVSLPGFPAALVGMEAFAEGLVILDLGGGHLHASHPLDLTIGR